MHLSKFKRTEPFGADRLNPGVSIASDNVLTRLRGSEIAATRVSKIKPPDLESDSCCSVPVDLYTPRRRKGTFISLQPGATVEAVVLPNRLSCFQELAAEFSAQGRDPALAQLVWGHGRAIRQPGTCLQSSFFVVEEVGFPQPSTRPYSKQLH
ncbi:hypothetical protein B0H14DRAFT_2645130 [Mycena olivaceomarginata]|nr:hypothetical protein B0H14DRAFT_2645130 [Mycena olivaceomarginata]